MLDNDMGYKEAKALFSVLQNKVISKIDPLRYLFQVPALTGKISRWLVLLIEFDIEYITTKVIKGRAVAEFPALNAAEGEEQWNLEFSDENLALIECREWKLYFHGAMNNKGVGLGVILITPEGENIPMAKKLDFKVTKNMENIRPAFME